MDIKGLYKHPNWGKIENGKVKIEQEYHDVWIDSKKIVLGSMPPKKMENSDDNNNNDINYFYGSHQNHFWNIINYINTDDKRNLLDKDNLCNYKYENSIEDRRDILKKNNIGIIDLFLIVDYMKSKNGEPKSNYADRDIIVKVWMPIDEILNDCKANEIYCTSQYVLEKLIEHFASEVVYNEEDIKNKLNHAKIKIRNVDRIFDVFVLDSPTARVSGRLFNNKKTRKHFVNSYAKLLDKEFK